MEAVSQRCKQAHNSNDESTNASGKKTKGNDGSLSLLSLVCDQQLPTRNDGKPQRAKLVHKCSEEIQPKKSSEDQRHEDATHILIVKCAKTALGIAPSIVICSSEEKNFDDNNDEYNTEIPAPTEAPKPKDSQSREKVTPNNTEKTEGDQQVPPFIWKNAFRPVPLPPRLPVVPAGFTFPLAKSPDAQ